MKVVLIILAVIGFAAFAGLVIIGGVLAVHGLLFLTEREEIARLPEKCDAPVIPPRGR